jgi:hypothetical protein
LVFTLLYRLCAECRSAGIYRWASDMAEMLGLSVRTVELALKKFQRWGLVATDHAIVKGKHRTIYWCLWLYRGDLRPAELDLRPDTPEAEDPPRRAQEFSFGAPNEFAPISSKELKTREPKDDRPRARKSRRPAAPCPEADADAGRGSSETPPPASIATVPDLDPAVVAALEAEIPDEAERGEVARVAAAWLLRLKVDRVVLIIRDVAERQRRKNDVKSFRALTEHLLSEDEKGRFTPRFVKAKPRPSDTNQPRPEEDAMKAERLDAMAAKEAERDALKDLLDALPGPEREAIEASAREKIEAESPGLPQHPLLIEARCLEMLAARLEPPEAPRVEPPDGPPIPIAAAGPLHPAAPARGPRPVDRAAKQEQDARARRLMREKRLEIYHSAVPAPPPVDRVESAEPRPVEDTRARQLAALAAMKARLTAGQAGPPKPPPDDPPPTGRDERPAELQETHGGFP